MNQATTASRGSVLTQLATALLFVWLAYLLIAPSAGFGWIDSWHNEQRAVQVILLCITGVVIAVGIWLDSTVGVANKHVLLLGAALLAFGLVSSVTASHVLAATAEVSLLVLLSSVSFIAFKATRAAPDLAIRFARYFALLSCTGYALGVAVRLYAAVSLGRGLDLDVLVLGYANPRFPSALHAVLIPFVAALVADAREKASLRGAAFVVLTSIWAINWGLGTRGIWFAFGVAIVPLIVLRGTKGLKSLGLVIAASALLGVLAFEVIRYSTAAMPGIGQAAVAPTSNATLTSREVLWKLSWDAIKEAPLLGIGPMHFAARHSLVGAHPHNWVLQVAAEWGIPALCVLTVLAYAAIRSSTNSHQRALDPGLALLIALALGLVDGNLVMPVSQSAVALIAGIAIGRANASGRNVRLDKGAKAVIGAVPILATCALSLFAYQSFRTQFAEEMQFLIANPGAWLPPRFWELGFL